MGPFREFFQSNRLLATTPHLVDRKYAGPADGYLGYDFLSTYKATIDMSTMCLKMKIDKIIEKENEIEYEITNNGDINELKTEIESENEIENNNFLNDDFLKILGHSYDFEIYEIKLHKNRSPRGRKRSNKKIIKVETVQNEILGGLQMPINIQNIENKYLQAVNFYKEKFDEINDMKIGILYNNEINETKTNANISDLEINSDVETNRSKRILKKLKLNNCTEMQKAFIGEICDKFPNQFYLDGDKLGSTYVVKHHIKFIPGAKPSYVRQYRIPQTQIKILNEFINDYEKRGIIEKCQSNFNSPAILVPKRDSSGKMGDYRFVVDYRKLNEISEIQNFPIPLIDDILNSLSGCRYFSTLDIKSAFHQILVDEASRDYTAFTTGHLQYRWVRMPFGLSSAPLTWQRAINTILGELIGNGVHVYLDDIIIYAKTNTEHDDILWKVMTLLMEHNMQLNVSKCTFYAGEFNYLGHIVSMKRIKANPRKIETIKNYPKPQTVKQIQSFLVCAVIFAVTFKIFLKYQNH